MPIDFTLPAADLMQDFDSLEAALRRDPNGDHARRLGAYFEQAELETRQVQLRSTEFEEKNMAGLLAEAFAAARRVVPVAWAKLHGRELAA